jgi:hypothetical protein
VGKLIAVGAAAWIGPSLVSFVLLLVLALASSDWGMSSAENAVMFLWTVEALLFAAGTFFFWRASKEPLPSLGHRIAALLVHGCVQAVTLTSFILATALTFNR